MRRSRALLGAAAVAVGAMAPAPAAAQRGWDAQGQALALVRDSTWIGGGLGAGMRFGRGLRLGGTLGAAWASPDAAGGRAELLVAYHVSRPRPGGVGVYAAAGLATELSRGDARALAVALLGVEARPWSGGGLFAELGIGGGLRLAAGYRVIRLQPRR